MHEIGDAMSNDYNGNLNHKVYIVHKLLTDDLDNTDISTAIGTIETPHEFRATMVNATRFSDLKIYIRAPSMNDPERFCSCDKLANGFQMKFRFNGYPDLLWCNPLKTYGDFLVRADRDHAHTHAWADDVALLWYTPDHGVIDLGVGDEFVLSVQDDIDALRIYEMHAFFRGRIL